MINTPNNYRYWQVWVCKILMGHFPFEAKYINDTINALECEIVDLIDT